MMGPRAHLIAVGAVIATLGASPLARADDGSYTVWSCRGPDQAAISAQSWQRTGDPIVTTTDTCATGGALTVTMPRGASPGSNVAGGYRFQSAPGTEIVGYQVLRSASAAGLALTAGFFAELREDDVASENTAVDNCHRGNLVLVDCDSLGTSGQPFAGDNRVERTGLHVHSLSIFVGCAGLTQLLTCLDSGGVNARYALYSAAVEIADAAPPTLATPPNGELLTGAAGGVQVVGVPLADAGGGVRSAQALIDGTPVADAAIPDCQEPFTAAAPCPSSTTVALQIDTTALADGDHQLEIVAEDVAGNAATVLSQAVRVSNPPPGAGPNDPPGTPGPTNPTNPTNPTSPTDPGAPPAAPGPAPDPQTILVPPPSPAVRGDYNVRIARARVAAGGRASLGGRVLRRGGAAQPHAQLVLQRRGFGPYGGAWRDAGTLTADADGRFHVAIPTSAQQLRVRLLPPRATTVAFLSPTVDVVSRMRLSAAMSPTALHNHETVVLSGTIAGTDGAAHRKQVLVQSFVGDHWLVVDRIYANARGAFRWRYRFQRTTSAADYRFRVRVQADDDRWPWRTATTPTLTVHVQP